MRYVMWIAFRESSNLWTHIALLWSMPVWESLVILLLITFLSCGILSIYHIMIVIWKRVEEIPLLI